MTLAVALIAAAIALGQAWSLYTQARESRVALCSEVLDLWTRAADSWRIMIAVAMGGKKSFYSPMLSQAELEKLEKLHEQLKQRPLPGFSEEQLWLSHHTRTALGTISMVADLALSGRVSSSDAYSVLGLELARRSKPLRDVLDRNQPIWLHVDALGTQGGLRERIRALVDLMWVEAARRHDLSPHTLDRAAKIKREGSGDAARKRLRAQCEAARCNPLTKWRLERSLSYAESDDFWKRSA